MQLRQQGVTAVQVAIIVLLVVAGSLIGMQIYRARQWQSEAADLADVPSSAAIEEATDLEVADESLDRLDFTRIEQEAAKLDQDINIE